MVGPDAAPWDAFRQLSSKNGNIARGHLCIGHASSTFAHSDERLFACVCTRNRAVVEISDAILVAGSTHLQEAKKIASHLKDGSGAQALAHRKVHRPWECCDWADSGRRLRCKRVVIKPGARLPL
ncbi:hypothetical protein AQ611_17470 [Burkholderia singularis]|nr:MULTISPECIES: hypothetical protein [unclassified Burkholderia]AOK31377.1 hypothetical protein AQ611_17470 [Burkholderia sp. Bp7605]